MRRLEQGIPATYGYTAGSFELLKNEIERLEQRLSLPVPVEERVKSALEILGYYGDDFAVGESNIKDACHELASLIEWLDEQSTPKEAPQVAVECYVECDEYTTLSVCQWDYDIHAWFSLGNAKKTTLYTTK